MIAEIKNRISLLEDVLGKTAKEVQERIADHDSVDLSPLKFTKSENEFGKIFYKE